MNRERIKHVATICAKSLALTLVFVGATVGGLVLHLDLAAPRQLATSSVNRILEGTFRGRIAIAKIGSLHIDRARGINADVFDPEGNPIMHLQGVSARIGIGTLLRSLVTGDTLLVRISHLSIDDAELMIAEDTSGALNIKRTFDSPKRAPTASARDTDVSIADLHLTHAWVHGSLANIPVIDADLADLKGAFSANPRAIDIDINKLHIDARGIPGLSPHGTLVAHSTLPTKNAGDVIVNAIYQGHVGAIPVVVNASLNGKRVTATVDVAEATPGAIAAIAPMQIHLGANVSAHAEVHGDLPTLEPTVVATIGTGEVRATGTVRMPDDANPDLAASVRIALKNIDIATLQQGAPSSAITAQIEASILSQPKGKISGMALVDHHPGSVNKVNIPGMRIQATFTDNTLRGAAQVDEPGAPTTVSLLLAPKEKSERPTVLTFEVDTRISSLRAFKRAGALGDGRAHVSARGAIDFEMSTIAATASADMAHLSIKGVAIDQAFVTASALVSIGEAIEVSKARVTMERGDVMVRAQVGRIRIVHGNADINGVRIEGLGDPILASAHLSRGAISVTAKGNDLDLSRVTKFFGREEDAQGHMAFAVHLTPNGARDRVDVKMRDVRVRGIAGANAHIALASSNRKWRGTVRADDDRIGNLTINLSDVAPRGSVFDPSSWKNATGNIDLNGNIDLTALLERLPKKFRPASEAVGKLALSGKASRASLAGDAIATLSLATKEVATTLGVTVNAITGHTDITAQLNDTRGPLISLTANADLPLAQLVKTPNQWLVLLQSRALDAHMSLPARGINTLPGLRTPLEGTVALEAELKGTLLAPKLTATATLQGLHGRGAARCDTPLNLDANLTYNGKIATVRLGGASNGKAVLDADGNMNLELSEALAGKALSWNASGNANFSQFPLEAVGSFLRLHMGGDVSGKVAVRDLKRAASLEADLDLRALSLEHTVFPSGKLHVQIKDGSLSARARLDQTDGYLEAKGSAAMNWGTEIAPSLNSRRSADFSVEAKNFRIDAAKPFVEGLVSEIDGRIDSNARIHVEPGGKDSQMDGAVVIRDGIVQVPQVGDKFHSLKGRIVMKPWGTVRFEEFSARASTGIVSMQGEAVLSGLGLKTATAKVTIQKGQSLPIAVEGVPVGKIHGEIKLNAATADNGKRLNIVVDVPMLKLDLPQTTGNSVQPLEPDPDVRIGIQSGADFIPVALKQPKELRPQSDRFIRAILKLGNVEVQRDTTLDVFTQGEMAIELRDKARVTGQIRLLRGKLDLQGKQFTIDRGTVSFIGDDPANPLIVASAYWDAPNGTRVHADFTGKPKGGKLTLRSVPALSQDEILSLVLFGASDGAFGTDSKSSANQSTAKKAAGAAGGLAGGVLTQGINRILSGVSPIDISTRIDTSDANSPRPELTIPLTSTISTTVGYKLGVPTPGDNPDRVEVTLDWRFVRNWSLSTVVGDQGSTAVDVLWRMRY